MTQTKALASRMEHDHAMSVPSGRSTSRAVGSRDLHGYGGTWPDLTWPNGARLAVSIVVNFEEGAELQVGDGDPVSEVMGEVLSVVERGRRDMGQEQIFAYGMRAGLWRMLDALDARAFPATFFMCGRAVERCPDLAATVVSRGHEAACHGWLWQPHTAYATLDEESADLDRCVRVIEDATGTRPVGFFCRGSESIHTRRLLAERGFLYTSNAFDDDLPYMDPDLATGRLVVVPYALDTNDMKFFHPNGFVRSAEMVDFVGDALKTLLGEADRGKPRLLNIGFHLRIVGRPARFQAFMGILDLLQNLGPRIWIARRDAIARAFLADRASC
jgi:peptidoglycan/xylan/chitin deacetylase (PgdA/CDA1 family)